MRLPPVCPRLFRIAADRKGAIAITMALAAVMLLGFAGLGVDVASWENAKRDMQGAADQAAYSAAIAVNAGGAATQNAQGVTAQMGFVGSTTNCAQNSTTGVTVCVSNPPTQGTYAGYPQGWEVNITQPQQTFLSRLFLASVGASADAVAMSQIQGNYCILQLDQSTSFSLSGTGSAVTTPNCNIQVDSKSSSSAADCNGNNTITANILSVAGKQNCTNNVTTGTTIISPSTTISDPYASTPVPSYTCGTDGKGNGYDTYGKSISNVTETLYPALYNSVPELVWCDSQGLTIGGSGTTNVTLSSGVYIINGGELKINSNATVTGTDVTFVLVNGAYLDIAGGANVTLTAPPTSSTWGTAGLVFFQPASDTNTATIGGGGTVNFTGTLYFGGALVNYNGGSTGSASTCTHLIAGTIDLSGTTTFANSGCTGVTQTISGSAPQLVE